MHLTTEEPSYFKGRNIGNDAFPNALSEFNSWFLKEAARSALTGYKIVEAFYSLQLSGVNWVVTVNDIATNGANPADLAPLLLKLPMASGGKYRIITRSGKVLSEISREDVRVLSAMHFPDAVLSATTGRYGGKVIPNSVLAKWAITVEQKARAQGRSLVIVPHATAAQLRGNRALHQVSNGVEYIYLGPNPTRYEIIHECLHSHQYHLDPGVFIPLIRKGGPQAWLQREQFVYDFIRKYYWDMLTPEERRDAANYLEQVRRRAEELLQQNPQWR